MTEKGEPLEAVLTGAKRHPNLVTNIAWCAAHSQTAATSKNVGLVGLFRRHCQRWLAISR